MCIFQSKQVIKLWFWIKKKCPGFIGKKTNGHQIRSPDLSPLDYHDRWHSSLKRLNCWQKSCAKFDSLLLNIQDATACSLVYNRNVAREHWIQRITFAAEINAACSRGSVDTQRDAESHNTFSAR